jgi:hypothetical protein
VASLYEHADGEEALHRLEEVFPTQKSSPIRCYGVCFPNANRISRRLDLVHGGILRRA